eukprot:TRINITY_DN93880_c0_g1_i1.p1 TRINITY_DN93880_c0_g1~~TRINITY_DN93880_c0_g1_i1.p1  ORF type:complete len:172 (-),score=7.54 TRINITY_DN93880_c0_g1_i1:102-617(-)
MYGLAYSNSPFAGPSPLAQLQPLLDPHELFAASSPAGFGNIPCNDRQLDNMNGGYMPPRVAGAPQSLHVTTALPVRGYAHSQRGATRESFHRQCGLCRLVSKPGAAIVIFVIGWFICPVWLAGGLFLSSQDRVSQLFGALSLVMACVFAAVLIGLYISHRQSSSSSTVGTI